jgi:pantoate--beta-alanine ligase
MQIFRKISELQSFLKDKNRIGFVPTMGALHQGHLSLVKKSLEQNNCTVVSIFVNPSQFNDKKDFEKYPRTEKVDLNLLAKVLGIGDCVFLPKEEEMNFREFKIQNYLIPKNLKNCMCGRTRHGHFEGVVEVIAKFLGILNPFKPFSHKGGLSESIINMYLGEKDYQQLKILEDFVLKNFKNVKVISCDTVREKDGLAMSSRNIRLNEAQRKIAINLYKEIFNVAKKIKMQSVGIGRDLFIQIASQNILNLQNQIASNLEKNKNINVDYIEIRDADNLRKISRKTKKIIIAGAIFVGEVRLIDNVVLEYGM